MVFALLLAFGACGDGDGAGVDAGDRATTTTDADDGRSSTTVVDDIGDDGAFTTTRVSTPPEERGLLVAVRHASHGDVYRVVFEFDGGVPGYDVRFAERPIVQDGSGDEIAVGGAAVLTVDFEPSSAVDLQGEDAVETYTGPKRIAVDSPQVAEIVRVGDFEGQLVWALGIAAGAEYRVTALTGPPRVVVDVRRSAS